MRTPPVSCHMPRTSHGSYAIRLIRHTPCTAHTPYTPHGSCAAYLARLLRRIPRTAHTPQHLTWLLHHIPVFIPARTQSSSPSSFSLLCRALALLLFPLSSPCSFSSPCSSPLTSIEPWLLLSPREPKQIQYSCVRSSQSAIFEP